MLHGRKGPNAHEKTLFHGEQGEGRETDAAREKKDQMRMNNNDHAIPSLLHGEQSEGRETDVLSAARGKGYN